MLRYRREQRNQLHAYTNRGIVDREYDPTMITPSTYRGYGRIAMALGQGHGGSNLPAGFASEYQGHMRWAGPGGEDPYLSRPALDTTPYGTHRNRRAAPVRNDADLYEDVCRALSDEGELDASAIEVRVEGGVVVLTGSVMDRRDRWLAEDVALSVTGVRDVENRLTAPRISRA